MSDNPMTVYGDLALSINNEMTQDEVMEVIDKLEGALVILRDINSQAKHALLEYMQEHGPIEFAGNKYCVGKKKTVKCRDRLACLKALLAATGGDFDATTECLSTQPFKPASTMKRLGDEADAHFETTFTEKVEVKKIPLSLLK